MGNLLERPITEKETEQGAQDGIRYAASGMQGYRPEMEDEHIASLNVAPGLDNFAVFGVFDGHGGDLTSRYVELQNLCKEHGIPIKKIMSKMKEGWWGKQSDTVGRSKGSLKILWERGWIDPAKLYQDYTLDGKKDRHGNVMKETSLKYMMSQLYDYSHEETSLQKMGQKMGVIVDRTPKCHCEIAGEGIEYSWGLGKNKYRALPIAEKKGKATFHKSVQKCTSRDSISKTFIRKASRQAREYMVSYKLLADGLNLPETAGDADHCELATPIMLQKVLNAVRTHRCAMDFDHGFIVANTDK